jgi:hypothetical protein
MLERTLFRRPLVFASLAVVALLVAWLAYRRQPAMQVPATFERLATAFADHDAADVLAVVDRGYDFNAKWPHLFPEPQTARGQAQRLLALAFLHHRQDQLTCTWTLEKFTEQADGSIEAIVTLQVDGGLFAAAVPPLRQHRFVLVRGSWLMGRFRIADHAPFTLTVPASE